MIRIISINRIFDIEKHILNKQLILYLIFFSKISNLNLNENKINQKDKLFTKNDKSDIKLMTIMWIIFQNY